MSFPKDLDEYAETELQDELVNRAKARTKGVCDYCGRRPSEPVCKFPERHKDKRIEPEERKKSSGIIPIV